MSKIPPDTGVVSSRRGFLKHGVGVGIGGLVAGCGRTVIGGSGGQGSEPAPNTPIGPTQTTDTQPSLSGAVQVNARVTQVQLGVVGTDFVGFSFEKSDLVARGLSSGNANTINMFKALGSSVIRIGGSSADSVNWVPGSRRTGGQLGKADLDSFANFVPLTGWRVIYGIGLLNRSATNPAQVAAAAEEAQYAIDKMGNFISAFTLGNEPDDTTYGSGSNFIAQWLAFKNVIVNQVGDRAFAGPDTTGSGNATRYAAPFLNSVGSRNITLLTHHFYQLGAERTNDPSTDIKTLLTFTTNTDVYSRKLFTNLGILKQAADSAGLKFRITEANTAINGGELDVSDTYASALWSLDLMFQSAQGGASGVNFHGGVATYAPFSFGNSGLISVQPLYYGMLFFTMLGTGPVLSSSIDAGSNNISIYAINTTSGYSVLFVNKEVSQSFEVTLNLPAAVSSATSIYMRAAGLTSKTGVTIQNGSVSVALGQLVGMEDSYQVGVSGSNPVIKVPALTAVLVKLS